MSVAPSASTSVYIHFPWCARKCPYCDFATTRAPDVLPHEAYADAVIAELKRRGPFEGRPLESVFFGGGTPSLWHPDEVGRVLEAILQAFETHAPSLEVSAESNPASLDDAQAKGFAAVGINRISLGVQSLRNPQLAFLGRLHDRQMALGALAIAQRHVPRVSADLMFGMAMQPDVRSEIEAALNTGVRHVSAYALTIEPGTQFGERARLGKLPVGSGAHYAELYEEAEARFAAAGFEHYEVSNYAVAGEESRHNQHYWRGGDYLGLGAAAVGALSQGESAARYKNAVVAERYMAGEGEAEREHLDPSTRIQEALMLGLRTREGVNLEALGKRTGVDPLRGRERAVEGRIDRGDLCLEGERLFVPQPRWLFLDGIVADLF
ncbi:MAG: radical SAM family heme chaperone HemW [Myxococcota bacterium]